MSETSSSKLLTSFCCSFCKSHFFIKDLTLKGSKCPVLLHCGHSICNQCLQQNLRGTNNITCILCGFVSSWKSIESFNKCFSFNLYVMGSLVLQNSRFEREKKLAFWAKSNSDFNYAPLNQSKLIFQQDLIDNICEECSMKATWHCENCKSNFCEICWTKVHGAAKSLTKHFRSPISDVKKIGFKKCTEHETQNLEFYCKDCSKTVCSHCVILQHQGEGHCSITLKEKNLEIFNEVKIAAEDAHKICRRMKQTLEELKVKQTSAEPREIKPYGDIENKILKNFSRIHGILQLEEERLIKKLHDKSYERENCFRSLQSQLEKQMEAIENLLRECEVALKKPHCCDLTDLYRQLTEVTNLPCFLISQNSENKEPKVEFDEKLMDSLRNFCKMDLPLNEVLELRSSSNLPEGHPVDPLNPLSLDKSLKECRESNATEMEAISVCSTRESRKDGFETINNLSKASKEPKVFLERKSYCVRISFIKSPGEFYVTLNSQRAKQKAIDKQASAVAHLSSAVPQTYGKGEIYLVKYNVDQKWYRGRVMEVIPSKTIGGEESVVVYYLDYGNFETVPVSRLRPIPPDLLEESPLAIKCKLFDCVPQSSEWCAESTETMEKILKNHLVTMFVMKVQSDCLEVDLSVIYPEGQIGRDIVSVRDALLFLGFSSFVHGFKVPRNATAFRYLDQCLPSVGETFDITVTHVNSPSDFYIQRTMEDAYNLYKLAKDLQSFYEENHEKGMIYNPTLDMPCAALFSADHRWYRAKIVDIPGKKMVTVFYVDYGNKETIQWTEIRKLKENFAKCPPLAFNCALAGIFPIDGGPWSSHAKLYMKKTILMREGYIAVQGKSKSRQKLKVFLYKKMNKKKVCINTSCVDMGIAVAAYNKQIFGMLASHGNYEEDVLNMDERKSESESEKSQVFSEKDVGNSGVFQDRKKNKLSAKELRQLYESEKQNQPEERFSIAQGENNNDEYKNIFKVKVDILSSESPSCLYVTFPTLMTEFENLQKNLNDFYQKTSNSDMEWTVGSICAVFDSTKRSWYRASISAILPDDRVQVFLKDTAQVISEPVSSLRVLDPLFKKYSSCAIKCHLADVKPAGEKWPGISCEFLSEELENHKEVYMTKRGQTENGSLPVELWVQKILSGGALEPIKKEWVTLNRLLVSQGLAIPVKLERWPGLELSTEDDESSDGENSQKNQRPKSAEPLSDKKNLLDVSPPSEVYVPSVGVGWLPALPLERSRFVGKPTYVDFNAFIYMYDIEKDEENLKKIREVLLEEYENSKPNPEDHFWVPGQLCIARYHGDNFWYRGLILQEQEDRTYDVLFVDYGNTENCEVADLRKGIKMHDVPILTHKFKLHGIVTNSEDGEWPVFVTDFLHSLIVDKKCEVDILKCPKRSEEVYSITLKVIENDMEVAMFLVQQNLAALDISVSNVICPYDEFLSMPSEVEGDSDMSRYVPLVVPDNCNEFFIEVTSVSSELEFFANIVADESLPPSLTKILKEYKILQAELTEEGHLQPPVENLIEDHPCCCLYFTSNKWCRGQIESFVKTKNLVRVSYVDYGTTESLHKDFVRQCKDNWVNFPRMAVKFKLGGVEKSANVPESIYTKALTGCLKRTQLFAEILKKHKDFLEVRLCSEKDGPLAYQKMIDEGLMKFI